MIAPMDRRRFCLALGAILPASFVHAQTAETPAQIVTTIYKISAGKSGKYDGPSAIEDKRLRGRTFSAGFASLYDRTRQMERRVNEPIIDFDPVTSSQDPMVHNLSIASEKEEGGVAIVAARFLYSPQDKEPFVVRYHFIREKGGWRLDDITGATGNDTWSLRQIMTEGIAAAEKQLAERKGRK